MGIPERIRHILILAALLILGSSPGYASQAFVTTTSFEVSGSTSRVDLAAPYSTTLDEYTIHADAVVRHEDHYVYVLNRLFSDNVLVLDADSGFSLVQQYSLSAVGANPRDLVRRSAAKGYISLYENNQIWVGNPQTGALLTTVDLSALVSDADGLVEADQMARLGDHVFVALQALDRSAGWVPSGHSAVAVIDASTDTLVDVDPVSPAVDAISLQYQNPFWEMRYEPQLQRLVVLCAGNFLDLDGALELVNPFTLQSEGALITEAALGGDLLDFELVDGNLAYALIEKLDYTTCLMQFDPSQGTLLGEVYCSDGFQLQNLELSRDHVLLVGDRTPSAPGLRLFDADTGGLLAGPLDVGLPPFDAVVIEDLATPVSDLDPGPGRLRTWPNPAYRGQSVHVAAPGAASRALAIYDARGRRVRQLLLRDEEMVWDGRDDRGRSLAPGVYFVRSLDGHGPATKWTLLEP